MPLQDDHLPDLLLVLHDTAQTLHEAGSEQREAEQGICARIEQWEQALLAQLMDVDSSISREKLISRC